ncbi:Phosphatidylinositol 3,4,5-trisphosphate 3-phosphatase tpte2 [Halocaridina rubra]|uniref:Phosphatidylinositol 3,4,5-trisphosphate 3-phosphatase tpte2 n=1 Tax=Halocaridina rubra TaxID=373956 RepID=A0AAN8WMT7_HALRR
MCQGKWVMDILLTDITPMDTSQTDISPNKHSMNGYPAKWTFGKKVITDRKIPCGYENSPFFFWFNTGFINNKKLRLERHELDNPHKSKTWHVFNEDFAVTVEFENDTMTKAY